VEVAALGGGEREPVVTPIAMAEAGAGGRVRHTLQRLRRAGSAATTDAAGRYALHDLPAGVPLAIIARGATTLPARSGRLVLAPEEERVVDLRLAAGGILAVHVLDADGAPLSGCLVHLRPEAEGGERMETTDSAGIARLVSLPGGDYQLACDWPWTGAPPSERPPRPVHGDAGSQEEVVIRW